MFYEAIKFDIDLSKWNVTSVSKMDVSIFFILLSVANVDFKSI